MGALVTLATNNCFFTDMLLIVTYVPEIIPLVGQKETTEKHLERRQRDSKKY